MVCVGCEGREGAPGSDIAVGVAAVVLSLLKVREAIVILLVESRHRGFSPFEARVTVLRVANIPNIILHPRMCTRNAK